MWFLAGLVALVGKMAFMGEDGWKSGLSVQQTNKVNELEKKVENLSKANNQNQLRFENLEQSLAKSERKIEEEKQKVTQSEREVQSLGDKCQELENLTAKLQHDVSAKDQLNSTLQGQLEAKARQLDKMKKGDFETQHEMAAPAAPTPVKPAHPSRQSFSVTPQKQDAGFSLDAANFPNKIADLERKLNEKDNEIKDLQSKLLEKTSVNSSF